MPRRHQLARKKPTVKHTVAEKAHLRALKKRSGPCALRRKERRAHLQPKPKPKTETE